MGEPYLQLMTRELCHQFYQRFENDPATFMDMSRFAPYQYDPARVDAYFDAQQDPARIVFMVMLDDAPVGEVKLKSIDCIKKECSLGIHMRDDPVKGKGYGTRAEQMAIHYAFNVLGMQAINADAVLKNTRSQHVLEKLGFQHTHSDDTFKFYHLEKRAYAQRLYELAMKHIYGDGVPEDNVLATKLLTQAHGLGHVEATYNLGICYHYGFGADIDLAKAYELYLESANAGYGKGMELVGRFYNRGIYVERDRTQAEYWLRKAIESPDPEAAKEALKEIARNG